MSITLETVQSEFKFDGRLLDLDCYLPKLFLYGSIASTPLEICQNSQLQILAVAVGTYLNRILESEKALSRSALDHFTIINIF